MPKSKYKATATVYARVQAEFKEELKAALEKIGVTESFFVRATCEALICQIGAGDDLALPIRLLTVDQKRKRKPG